MIKKKIISNFNEYTKKDKKFKNSVFNLLKNKLDTAIKHASVLEENERDIQARADIYKIFLNDLEMLRPKS